MKYLIYVRVSPKGSTWASSESSLDMQVEQCRNYIRGEPCRIVRDEFYTAKDSRRPGLQQIIAELQAGTADWDAIIVYKIDRLTRSLRDGGEIFELLMKQGKGFVSVTENIDMSTPVGRAMLWIIHVFAQLEREQLGERTRDKMVSIAAGGEYAPGLTPFGYMRTAKHCNTLAVDPAKAEIVREIFRCYAGGESTTELSRRLDIRPQQITVILRNRHYLGLIHYAGMEYPGRHTAIITEDEYNAVQRRLPQHRAAPRPAAQQHVYLLSGLIKCQCGRHMTAKSAHGKTTKCFYYTCTDINCRNSVNAVKLEKSVLKTIGENAVSPEFLNKVCDRIRALRDEWLDGMGPESSDLDAAERLHLKERDAIDRAFLSGVVTPENQSYWNQKLSAVNIAIERIARRRNEMREASKIDLGVFTEAGKLAKHLKHLRDLLTNTSSDQLKREAALAHIKEIRQQSKTRFAVEMNYKSSPNAIEWLPRKDLNLD